METDNCKMTEQTPHSTLSQMSDINSDTVKKVAGKNLSIKQGIILLQKYY